MCIFPECSHIVYLENYREIKTLSHTVNSIVKLVKCKVCNIPYIAKYINKSKSDAKNEVYMTNKVNQIKELENSVCKIYNTFETETHYILILEYIKGGDLFYFFQENYTKYMQSIYKHDKLFYLHMIENIFTDLVKVVNTLHSKNIIHLDIKLENVLIVKNCNCNCNSICNEDCKTFDLCKCFETTETEIKYTNDDNMIVDIVNIVENTENTDNPQQKKCECDGICKCVCCGKYRVVLIDFSFSQVYNVSTITTKWKGTFNYCAPEICKMYYLGEVLINFNIKNDIWAMGVLLYALITGNFPFCANSLLELYPKHKNIDLVKVKINKVNTTFLNPKYITILNGLLQICPHTRFDTNHILAML